MLERTVVLDPVRVGSTITPSYIGEHDPPNFA